MFTTCPQIRLLGRGGRPGGRQLCVPMLRGGLLGGRGSARAHQDGGPAGGANASRPMTLAAKAEWRRVRRVTSLRALAGDRRVQPLELAGIPFDGLQVLVHRMKVCWFNVELKRLKVLLNQRAIGVR